MPRAWLRKRKRDQYYRAAKRTGYRSRAAYKLRQIAKKFSIIRTGDVVLDLGAAPGGWSQIAKEIVGEAGTVLAVDRVRIRDMEGISTLTLDLDTQGAVEQLKEWIGGPADVVLSDISPRLSGNKTKDHALSVHLSGIALAVAAQVLRKGGNAVIKVFQGDVYDDYLDSVKKQFSFVKGHRPKATISESAEIYVIAKGFRG
ncbi:MAG: RlmE family RNA methyltransferase [Thermoplasmata archaeon]|nr:RlmE family RNA methyltransferase [Thermoplasmata archaeon]